MLVPFIRYNVQYVYIDFNLTLETVKVLLFDTDCIFCLSTFTPI